METILEDVWNKNKFTINLLMRDDEVQNESKQIICKYLMHYFKTKDSSPKYFSAFKFPSKFSWSIRDGEIKLERVKKGENILNQIWLQ